MYLEWARTRAQIEGSFVPSLRETCPLLLNQIPYYVALAEQKAIALFKVTVTPGTL